MPKLVLPPDVCTPVDRNSVLAKPPLSRPARSPMPLARLPVKQDRSPDLSARDGHRIRLAASLSLQSGTRRASVTSSSTAENSEEGYSEDAVDEPEMSADVAWSGSSLDDECDGADLAHFRTSQSEPDQTAQVEKGILMDAAPVIRAPEVPVRYDHTEAFMQHDCEEEETNDSLEVDAETSSTRDIDGPGEAETGGAEEDDPISNDAAPDDARAEAVTSGDQEENELLGLSGRKQDILSMRPLTRVGASKGAAIASPASSHAQRRHQPRAPIASLASVAIPQSLVSRGAAKLVTPRKTSAKSPR